MDKFRQRLINIQEKKDRRKARRFSTIMLLILLLAIWLPIITQTAKAEQEVQRAILVQFEEVEFKEKKSRSAERSSSRPAPSEETVETPEEPEPAPPPTEQIPEPRPIPEPVSKISDLPVRPATLTSPSREIAFAPMLQDLSRTARVREVSDEVVEVTEEVSNDDIKSFAKFFKENATGRSSGSGKSTPNDNGTSSDAGEGDSGTSATGDSDTDGKADSGDEGFEFDGDGLLTRKVIYRANLNEIIKETGKIVMSLCVNREGAVTFAEADRKTSTIKNENLLRLAELTFKKYRYEKDYTVSDTQCGKFSFIFNIQN